MAIEKIEGKPKVEWTPSTLIHLGVTIVFVLLSCLFGWLAFANWRFKTNLVEGYQEYDRGRPPVAVKQPLETALSWRPIHTGARELLAKVLCDEGALEKAREHYTILDKQGYRVPQVHIGLGVLALKEAEAAAQPKQVEALVNEAAGHFKQAPGVPEAEIGIGHCDLVLARKLANPAYYARAQKTFTKVQTAMETSKDFRGQITRDGLIDYYTGLGKALSSIGTGFDENARAAFLACYQYTPTWSLPMSNVLSLEARRFAQMNENNDVLLKLAPDINSLRNQARLIYNGIKQREEKEAYREAWIMFSLALGQAWGRAGNLNELAKIVTDLSGGSDRLEQYVLDAQIKTDLGVKDDPNPSLQEQYVTKAGQAYNELIQRLPGDDANREKRAKAYNNSAWTLTWRGSYLGNESYLQQAVARMIEALRLYPDDYIFNRNMAVILKRFRKPPSNPAAFVDKCRAAVAKDKDYAEDFDKLQQYMGAK